MKKLFTFADMYLDQSDWKDIALIKICLCALGVMIGISIPAEKKKIPLITAAIIFTVTWIPLISKFLRIAISDRKKVS